jgi:Flp pilus assembly protein TadD
MKKRIDRSKRPPTTGGRRLGAPGSSRDAPFNAPVHSEADRTRRIVLLGLLVAMIGAFWGTSGWRRRLWQESARSRRAVALAQQAQAARERQLARRAELESLLRTEPGLVEARMELAQLRWADTGPGAAASVLEQSPDRSPDRGMLRMLAAAQRSMGREDLALRTLSRAIRLWPDDAELRTERAMLFSLLGWFPQARAELDVLARHGTDSLPVVLVRVTMARQEGDFRTARSLLESARQRSPTDGELRRQLAAVAEAEGHESEAVALLEGLAPAERDPEVLTALARLYLRHDRPEALARARATLQAALAQHPGMPSARLLLGRCLRLSGELREASSLLERLYKEQPRRAGVAFELAQVYRASGRAERAGPLILQHQASLREHERMRRAALAVMTRPDSAAAHQAMGRLCLQNGMQGRAILSFERAEALDPSLVGIHEELTGAQRATIRSAVREQGMIEDPGIAER